MKQIRNRKVSIFQTVIIKLQNALNTFDLIKE